MKKSLQSKVINANKKRALAEYVALDNAMRNPKFVYFGEREIKGKYIALIESGYIKTVIDKKTGEIVPFNKALTSSERKALVKNGIVLGFDSSVPCWAD